MRVDGTESQNFLDDGVIALKQKSKTESKTNTNSIAIILPKRVT